MSLTSHLKDSGSLIHQFLRTRFPNTRKFLADAREQMREADTIRPNGEVPWITVGTALDYRIRYYFAVTPPDQLVAYSGGRIITDFQTATFPIQLDFSWSGRMDDSMTIFDRRTGVTVMTYSPRYRGGVSRDDFAAVMQQAQELGDKVVAGEIAHATGTRAPLRGDLENFFSSLEIFTEFNQPVGNRLTESEEAELNRYCVVLALLENVRRAGLRSDSRWSTGEFDKAEALTEIAKPEWIEDLNTLSWKFYDSFNHLLSLRHVLNPTFDGSVDVGGADADLIVDGALIDIKTTIKQQIQGGWLWQLLGYVLLDYSDRHGISSVGLYMARQGILFEWDVEDVIRGLCSGEPPSIEQLRSQFKELAPSSRQGRVRVRRMRSRGTPSDASG